MLGEAARDPNVTYNVQKFTYTFDGVELCGRGAIRYIGWGQILKTWGQISAAVAPRPQSISAHVLALNAILNDLPAVCAISTVHGWVDTRVPQV